MVLKAGFNSCFKSSGTLKSHVSAKPTLQPEDLRRFCEHGQLAHALQLVNSTFERGISVSTSVFYILLLACIDAKDLAIGRRVHQLIFKSGLGSDCFLGSHLIRMFASCGDLQEANRVFRKLPEPNVFAWSAIISAHVKHGHSEQAIGLYHQMQQSETRPNAYVFVAILKACTSTIAPAHGKVIHGHIIQIGIESEVFVGSALINLYSKCGSLEDMRIVFESLPKRDVVAWNATVAGYAQQGYAEEALLLFQQMQRVSIRRNVATWNAIITGFAQHGFGEEALELFKQMQGESVQPSTITFVSVLNACASVAALDQGKIAHADITDIGFDANLFVGNALINMYAKCGSLDDAQRAFEKLANRDAVTWNAMMAGYALHNRYEMILEHFAGMQQEGVKPNDVSFACLLAACSRLGLLEQGFDHFKSLRRELHLSPKIDHYTCIADLLGRAGYLKDAKHVLQSMPFQPDLVVWRSFLHNCKAHGHVDLGRQSFDNAVVVDCAEASAYVLMSNMYTDVDMGEAASEVHELRNFACAWKKPGVAFIEVDNKVHNFIVEDQGHANKHEVNIKVKRSSREMKEKGVVPHVDSALKPCSDEPIQDALWAF